MRHGSPILFLFSLATPAAVACLLAAQSKAPVARPPEAGHNGEWSATVIFTAAPVYDSLAALRGEERFPQGAQLMVQRGDSPEPLVDNLCRWR